MGNITNTLNKVLSKVNHVNNKVVNKTDNITNTTNTAKHFDNNHPVV